MAEEDLTCPDGVGRKLFEIIKTDFEKARVRHHMSVSRNATQKTIDKNKRLKDEAKAECKEFLADLKANPEVLQQVRLGNQTTSTTLVELRQFVHRQSDDNKEIKGKLDRLMQMLQGGSTSSSSSSSPLAVVVNGNMAVVGDVMEVDAGLRGDAELDDSDLPECIVCMSGVVDPVKMPCCSRVESEKLACKTCFWEVIRLKRLVACPMCRTELNDKPKRIYRYFKSLIRQWEDDLSRRPDAIRRTAAGKNETKTLKQCKDYIRPLFHLCKRRELEGEIRDRLFDIVVRCEIGEFVRAHDAYMDVAIGRAAWPIGVTMVGIHARSGRAKIESSNVAHMMNSEVNRKYLTSVKRLMSYAQKKRPDVHPSKKVTNV